ncbi:MAG: pyrroloquinoline quinone-dependent dehydrogenase, partial [Halomonas sp.]
MPIFLPVINTRFKAVTSGLGTATVIAACLTPLTLLAQDQPGSPETRSQPQGQQADADPIPLVPGEPIWNSFHGQLNAQKYSPLEQINTDNVGDLEKVWEVHTGDVSDGHGDLPPTVWSATPVFANDTLYIGTPFYRILALDPGTGEEKWSFDTQSTLEALTQPALKNRGVA